MVSEEQRAREVLASQYSQLADQHLVNGYIHAQEKCLDTADAIRKGRSHTHEIAAMLAFAADRPAIEGDAVREAWQPIDTAPKDGTLIWLSARASMRIGYWMDGIGNENFGTEGGGWIDFSLAEGGRGTRGLRFAATHWMALPQPLDLNSLSRSDGGGE